MASSKLNNGTVNTTGARLGVQQMVYNKLSEYYNYGMDTTKSAVDRTFSLATHTCALSLGLAIVTSQLGLIATTSATNVFLSSLIYTKNRGNAVLQGAMSAEKAVEQRIQEAIDTTMQLAKVPADKVVEHTNSFLDIANTVFDRILGLPPVVEPTDSSIPERVAFLSVRVSGGLVNQANNNVIDPVKTKLYEIAQQMQENIILADYVKRQKEWVQDVVLKPCENMTASVIDLKQKIEKEASAYYITPEEMLVRSIRKTSNLLNENIDTLRKQGTELVGEKAQHLESATSFIQQLDNNLAKHDNIYQIRDEVLVEAKQKVDEITRWTTGFIVGDSTQQQQPTVIPAQKEEFVGGETL